MNMLLALGKPGLVQLFRSSKMTGEEREEPTSSYVEPDSKAFV